MDLTFLNEEEKQRWMHVIDSTIREAQDEVEIDLAGSVAAKPSPVAVALSTTAPMSRVTTTRMTFAGFFSAVNKAKHAAQEAQNAAKTACKSEKQLYESDSNVITPFDFNKEKFHNPLLFWKKYQAKYPVLSKLARQYLGIPASSAPSERVWSLAGAVLTKTRHRLLPARLCRNIFLKHNYTYINELKAKRHFNLSNIVRNIVNNMSLQTI